MFKKVAVFLLLIPYPVLAQYSDSNELIIERRAHDADVDELEYEKRDQLEQQRREMQDAQDKQQQQIDAMKKELDERRAQQENQGNNAVDAPKKLSPTQEKEADAIADDVIGDHSSAIRILKMLADEGDAVAQSSLGDIYAKGRGIPQRYRDEEIIQPDYVEAYVWYQLTVENPIISQKTKAGEEKFIADNTKARDEIGIMLTPDQLTLAQHLIQLRRPNTTAIK